MPAILVLNAGSATLKYALYDESRRCLAQGTEEGAAHEVLLERALGRVGAQDLIAAGHRVVHGGDRFAEPVVLNDAVLAFLETLVPLAPLHQPHNLAAIRAVAKACPGLPQVACFDTAFHQSQDDLARRFALPRALHDAGVKRYGFHGLSYEYVSAKLPTIPGYRDDWRTIIAHLGNGSSLCAVRHGRSIASTMGFTALEGLMMGTRTGAIDPGVLLYLLEEKGMTVPALGLLLYKESGLLGVSGLSHDMRELLASRDARAAQAIALYVYRIVREIGSLAAALGGLDALVFTAGIGEHAAPVREAICRGAQWLSPFTTAVIPTDEEQMIARHTFDLCISRAASPLPA